MMLALLLVVPLFSGFACLGARSRAWAQGMTYAGLVLNCVIVLSVGIQILDVNDDAWLMELLLPWIPSWSVYLHLGIDSFSYWLIVLAHLLALCAVYISFPKHRIPTYFASLNWAVFGVIGLFLSADVFLFFMFWEIALLPIYCILLIDGEKLKFGQTLRFIVLTQISGLLLLIAIIALLFLNQKATGSLTFEYSVLAKGALSPQAQYWLLLLFLTAFLIKLPAIPFHGWLPSLFSEGPASAILVAILVKTSIFGLVRFSWPIFPHASAQLAMPMMIVGAATLLYGAILAFSQTDPKRIIAYGTLSHAGLMVMGVFCQHHASFFGVLIMLTASALSTAAMLIMFERRREVNFSQAFGLWQTHPKWSSALLVMVLASMGFPLFGNFLGEWLILWSVLSQNLVLAIVASLGIILSAAYGLRLFQRLCFHDSAQNKIDPSFADLQTGEMGVLGFIALVIIGLGLAPNFALEKVEAPLADLLHPSSIKKVAGADFPEVTSP